MDFDLSKENIQPLRGGRNVQQLGMALQAQTNRELQMELMHQRDEFENLIRTYNGDDPLENYYNYITWIEQSYPKHGHEGNLVPLLEHCLKLFENDKRYTHDRRFCKLWIKYFDLQPNPLELYHMMKSKGLCINCADLYKAWAYYYEAAGNFQEAYKVFEEGKRNLAQPYEELETAHQNLIVAAGEHMIFGRNENRLIEKRQALTSLHTYRSGRVPNVRAPSANGLVTVPSNSTGPKSNSMAFVYEVNGFETMESGAEAAPVSIITVAKRQEMVKENTLKPGPWTTVPVKKRVIGSKTTLGFTVHEDADLLEGIQLPKNHPKECYEDYSNWQVSIKYPEPPNPAMVPMYPKNHVYSDPNTEYSIDEIRASRYLRRQTYQNQEVINILDDVEVVKESHIDLTSDDYHNLSFNQFPQSTVQQSPKQDLQNSYVHNSERQNSHQNSPQFYQQKPDLFQNNTRQESFMEEAAKPDDIPNSNFAWGNNGLNSLWNCPTPPQSTAPNFVVYEQSLQEMSPHIQPKGSAMKTAFKVLNADELAETGSRGGMDIAATAQAADSAKPMPLFSDNSSSSFDDNLCQDQDNFDIPSNTQMFNFNLNAMKVSTPCTNYKRPVLTSQFSEEEIGNARKQLFTEPKAQEKDQVLSTIFEETKSYVSSQSSSSGATTKSSLFNNNTNKMGTISEEHNSYLAQNVMANAALRSSILGNLVDFVPAAPTVVDEPSVKPQSPIDIDEVTFPMQSSPYGSPGRHIPPPAEIQPLDYAPSDPFKANFIEHLLDRVSFPGPHTYGYIETSFAPRISLKKEPLVIGQDRYMIDKQLGKGTYGTVYKAYDLRRNKIVALKFQKPANKWEFYICREIQSRLASHPLKDRFMDVTLGYFNDQASILISDFMPGGSLLDLANLHKQKAGRLREGLVIYFCLQMLHILQALHSVNIIHADIKPDNFLVFVLPDNTIGLQLIDFGCSIDMTLLPPNSAFTRIITTENFVCCEMLDGRPWNYHTDMFCIAATAHVLLFDTYLKLFKKGNVWSISQRFPRYYKADLWNMFFSALLNQHNGPADPTALQFMLDEALVILNKDSNTALSSQMRIAVNLLKNR